MQLLHTVPGEALQSESIRQPATHTPPAPFATLNAPKEKEEEAIDVDSVFAKLKQLKTSE